MGKASSFNKQKGPLILKGFTSTISFESLALGKDLAELTGALVMILLTCIIFMLEADVEVRLLLTEKSFGKKWISGQELGNQLEEVPHTLKGQLPVTDLMNFWKTSKRPLTPPHPPYFRKKMLRFCPGNRCP